MSINSGGKIITFYSYKGGTGRSMALANIAWILASSRKRVLAVDWDLEAPGLHRYFRPFLIDKDLGSSAGVIDFVIDYATEAIKPLGESEPLSEGWYVEQADILRYAISLDWDFPTGGVLDFIPAGRQSSGYAARVNSFNWQNFYERLGGGRVLDAARDHMRREYDYILIDSRTGVSDTAGICTVQMPDALAVCFTFNNQSIEGAAAVARSAYEQRRKRGDRDFRIFPIPMRVDPSEVDKLNIRRRHSWWMFDPLLSHIASADRRRYWGEVEVPYIPVFAYEEILASFREEPSDPKTALSSMLRATLHLTGIGDGYSFSVSPERRQEILAEFARIPGETTPEGLAAISKETTAEEQVRLAEIAFGELSPSEQPDARRILTRLVRIAGPAEEAEGAHGRLRVRIQELGRAAFPLAHKLADLKLLTLQEDAATGERTVELADEELTQSWPRLRDWVEEDLEFLLWRQKLQDLCRDWEKSDHKSDFLLRGLPLKTAQRWFLERGGDLNEVETAFIQQSMVLESRSQYSYSARGLRAFIIRPFSVKQGIDFDRVERELIDPALRQLGVEGRTTIEILQAGNIRLDMFRRLLSADLVVADVSVHNANVFYELGVRHALRNKRTFLLRCEEDNYPFDLQTDRYFVYRKDHPGSSLSQLTAALASTLSSEDVDSPVFRSLPRLQQQDSSNLLAIPREFIEAVEQAEAARQRGDLKLLATEIRGLEWARDGWRISGRAQFAIKDFAGARSTWEAVREFDPEDLEANTLLGTIYQRLGDLVRSDQMIKRVLRKGGVTGQDRAEALSLLARNAKARWRAEWQDLPGEPRREEALRSPFLQEAARAYARAFEESFNHFYPGLNALAMLTVQIELAKGLPDVWRDLFDRPEDAEREVEKKKEQIRKLGTAVELSLSAARSRLARQGRDVWEETDEAEMASEREIQRDIWLDISEADFICLTAPRPRRVADAYRRALASVPDFALDAARSQLELYEQLDVLADNVQAALAVPALATLRREALRPGATKQSRILLFTGHMIDSTDRKEPRFPPEKEGVAREAIRKAVQAERARPEGVAYGIAGGASGGDILFHEVCAELGIPTRLYLALPKGQYIAESVQTAGQAWVERFNQLYQRHREVRVLSLSTTVPRWLSERSDQYSIWQRNNLWMLYNALSDEGSDLTLIALWNGQQGDGPGGTGDLVAKARECGAKVILLDTRELFH
jgi:hypothetical protein